MTQIHSEIAGEINAARHAAADGFNARKRDYIPDNPRENYAVLLGNAE